MRTVYYLFLLICFSIFSMENLLAQGTKKGFDHIKQYFIQPDKQYGTAPLWVWHTSITKELIDTMMKEFKEDAFGGVIVHPRPGLITEYLSPEWFDMFKYTVARGKELGLDVWMYDENSYPTGFAGGLVPDQMPESYNQGQMLRMKIATVLPDNTADLFLCLKAENGSFKDITPDVGAEKGKSGKYYLFTKAYYGKQDAMVGPPGFPYVDLMVKGVTEKFIEVTFKGYEKVAGKEFGKAVPGVFSDEPTIQLLGEGIRWTPDLFSSFTQKWGYDLQTQLPALFEESGDWKKVRHNYQQTLLDLFIDRWSKPMFAYTEKHKLRWTGHYWEHGWPSAQHGPDNMAMYAWHQQPGIDMLFNQFDEKSPHAQFGNIRSVKELTSVANQLHKQRTLSETYGGGGWELTFKDMKRLGDWQAVLGINFMNQHLSMMTITGARKADYPQSFSYHTPWWPYYKTLNQYFARVSFVLSQGEQKNDILIIEPTTTTWIYPYSKRLNEIGNGFQSFITTLEKDQVEYDLGSENIIKDHGKIENGHFVIGQRAYSTVVIPPGMENIDAATFRLLREYADKGGLVLLFEQLQTLDGSAQNELKYFSTKKQNIVQFDTLNALLINKYFRSADCRISGNGPDSIGGDLYHHRRMLNDGQLIFLSNASMDAAAKGQIHVNGGKDALLMDLLTGEITDLPEQEQHGKTVVDFNIPPAGSMLLFLSHKKTQGFKPPSLPGGKVAIHAGKTAIVRPANNTLMIDFCDLEIGDLRMKDIHVQEASKKAFNYYGFGKNPWDHQAQFKKEFVARDTFSRGTGFTVTYHFSVDSLVEYKKIKAVIEQGKLWSGIAINGHAIKPLANRWWLDRSFGVLEIGPYIHAGDNTLSVTTDPMRVYAEIEAVYILGDFNLQSAQKGWQIVAPAPLTFGSWEKQGLPLYGQELSYVKTFDLATIDQQYEVQLGTWKGTVCAIQVNGSFAGIIFSEPGKLNITRLLKKGKNRVEVIVVGSLKNLLGPHHNSPKPGMVGPGHWSNIKSYPPGSDYQVYDYGLMNDFSIVQYALQK